MTRKPTLPLGLLIFCVPISACNRDGSHENNNLANQTCTCTVYPFPAECTSVCKLTEYVVKSVNQNSVVVRTAGTNGASALEERTIPLSSLPPQEIQGFKPGSRVQVLTKIENGKPVAKSLHLMSEPASK